MIVVGVPLKFEANYGSACANYLVPANGFCSHYHAQSHTHLNVPLCSRESPSLSMPFLSPEAAQSISRALALHL